MLMSAHNGRVDHRVFIVGIASQVFEDLLPNAILRPAAEACMHGRPGTETIRQIAPRYAGAIAVEDRFDKQPIVLGGHPDMAFTAGQKVFNALSLVVAQGVAAHWSAPNQLTSHESLGEALGNPSIEDRLKQGASKNSRCNKPAEAICRSDM